MLRILMIPVALVRLLLVGTVVLLGGVAMVLLLPWPVYVRDIRLGVWPQLWMARAAFWIARVRVRCDDHAALRQHRGLVFPNHVSLVDIAVLLSVVPVRFMATRGVARIPVIGWLATMIGTVYVDRGSARSRAKARQAAGATLKANPYPPLALFPEGGIGPGDQVLPLRFGAFGLAAEHSLPILPVAIAYDPLRLARWEKGIPLWRVLWRIAAYPERVDVRVTPLPALHPQPGDELAQLATKTQAALAGALGVRVGTVPHGELRDQPEAWVLSEEPTEVDS
ncbi:MAG: lysophospholipid acyltransferase family protein [Bacteroidota bacterium]